MARRFRNRRNRRRRALVARRPNLYFQQHSEQARIARLITSTSIVKRIINVDFPIYIANEQFSFSTAGSSTVAYADFYNAPEFKRFTEIYQSFRIIGARWNIYRNGQPVLTTTQNTDHLWPLLGLNINYEYNGISQQDVLASDNTYWVSYFGSWNTLYKTYIFNKKTMMNEWLNREDTSRQISLRIATKGGNSIPQGYVIYIVSLQIFMEYSNPE